MEGGAKLYKHMEGGDKAGKNKEKEKGNGKINKSAPVGLVKEAVALFEERVHVADVDHVNRVQPISKPSSEVDYLSTKLEKVTLELKETKQNLQKSIEEGMVMATCLSILHKELEQTKHELQELKEKDLYFRYKPITGPSDEDWVEKDVKHVEDVTKIEEKPELIINLKELEFQMNQKELEFQKNDVTFANEPSLTKYIVPDGGNPVLERHPSLRTKKKKSLIEGIFSRRKGSKESSSLEEFDYREQIWS